MKVHRYPFFVVLNFIFFLSCTKIVVNENDLKGKFKATYTLEKNDEGKKKFVLDSESTQKIRCVQLFEDASNDSVYFTFLNRHNYSIYFYDFKTGDFFKKIELEKEGPNGVYPYVTDGYYIHSYDSIYYYSYNTDYLYLLNHKGEKYHTINYMADYTNMKSWDMERFRKNRIPPMLQLSTGKPMYKIDDTLYLCGEMTEEFGRVDSINHLLLTTIDTKRDDSIDFHVGYPESYREGNWGENYFRQVFWCMNPTTKLFLVSFPNDHYIYQTDLKQVNKIYAGSMYAGDIKSVDYPTVIPLPKDKRMSHYFENYSYSAIIYDKYRNVYYRMVEHPWKEYHQGMDWMPWLKQLSIVILDKDLHFIGETMLDMEYRLSASRFMLTTEGLLLHKQTDDEDELIFDLFTLTKL
jgi:hypothetical protein